MRKEYHHRWSQEKTVNQNHTKPDLLSQHNICLFVYSLPVSFLTSPFSLVCKMSSIISESVKCECECVPEQDLIIDKNPVVMLSVFRADFVFDSVYDWVYDLLLKVFYDYIFD
jgi:hypothetical protein